MSNGVVKKIGIATLIVIVAVIFFTPVICFSLNADYKNPVVGESRILDVPYTVYENGEAVEKEISSIFFPNRRTYTIEFRLPEIKAGEELVFFTRASGLNFKVNGDLIYSYEYPEGKTYPNKRMYHPIALVPSYSNCIAEVSFPLSARGPFLVDGPYIGSSLSNYIRFFIPYRPLVLAILALILVSVCSQIISLFVKKVYRGKIFIFSSLASATFLSMLLGSSYVDLILDNAYASSLFSALLKSFFPILYYQNVLKAFSSDENSKKKAAAPYKIRLGGGYTSDHLSPYCLYLYS